MSDYGLKILNDNLKLQIDSLYINYALWDHGENVNTVDQGSYHKKDVTFSSNTSQPPLIAIKPDTDDYCGLVLYLRSGSDYSGFTVYSEDKVVTFSWQAFVPRTGKSSEAYGLRVYNASSVLVFDSGYAPMIIADVDTCSPAYNSVASVSIPSDSNAYFIVSPSGKWQTVGEWNGFVSTIRNWAAILKKVNDTTVSFGGRQVSTGAIPFQIDASLGYWPSVWTIITVKKSF